MFPFIKAARRKYKTFHSLSLCSWDQLLATASSRRKKEGILPISEMIFKCKILTLATFIILQLVAGCNEACVGAVVVVPLPPDHIIIWEKFIRPQHWWTAPGLSPLSLSETLCAPRKWYCPMSSCFLFREQPWKHFFAWITMQVGWYFCSQTFKERQGPELQPGWNSYDQSPRLLWPKVRPFEISWTTEGCDQHLPLSGHFWNRDFTSLLYWRDYWTMTDPDLIPQFLNLSPAEHIQRHLKWVFCYL